MDCRPPSAIVGDVIFLRKIRRVIIQRCRSDRKACHQLWLNITAAEIRFGDLNTFLITDRELSTLWSSGVDASRIAGFARFDRRRLYTIVDRYDAVAKRAPLAVIRPSWPRPPDVGMSAALIFLPIVLDLFRILTSVWILVVVWRWLLRRDRSGLPRTL